MSKDLIRIGLVFSYSLSYYRDIVRGVRVFAESCPRWTFTPIAPDPDAIESIRPLDLNGLIAHIFTRELAGELVRLRKPVVNVSGVLPDLKIPRVMADHEQVGRLAAEHFLDRGLRHFGFFGYTTHAFSKGRELGFHRKIERAGFRVFSYLSDDPLHPEPTGLWRWDDELQHWLIGLPRPVGVLCSHDIQGVQLSEVCHRAGLSVPDDVALLGVDDDDLFCKLARPPLSSVALPGERIGFEAARMLKGLLSHRGRHSRTRMVLLPSPGVISRHSTSVLAVEDPDVATAVRFIWAHALDPIGVPDVLEAVAVSRRSLERRFRAILGRGLGEEICRVRMDKAKALLSGTEMPIAQVSTSSGFSEAKHLSTAFRRETGLTPTEFRNLARTR
jgi:LacI family transcriptional regulator, galactose operon repressor